MNVLDNELNEYLNPLLTQLMGDSFTALNDLYQNNTLKELSVKELEFFTKFIIDAREFYADLPDRMNDLNQIDATIKEIISSKNTN